MENQLLLNVEELRKDFSILQSNKELVYLDSSATSLTPNSVVDSIRDFYDNYNANIHRGIHKLSEKATIEYERAHEKVANFIGAELKEIIFTRGTTESLNLLAYCLTRNMEKGDEIIITEMEHHSNIVPWQQLAKQRGLVLKYIKVKEGELDIEGLKEMMGERTKIVSVTHMSNVLGTINDIKELGKVVHSAGALLVVDGAQGVPHFKIDVKELDCDFMAFSGHKMLGPTGIGVLYGKKSLLEKMDPFLYGGDMISAVYFDKSEWNELPWKFEAGTPPIAAGIGLGVAIDYLNKIGMGNIKSYEDYLTKYAIDKLNRIEGVKVFGPINGNRGGVISFSIEGVHSHDISTILDREGIAVRGGHLCAMPLVREVLGEDSVARVSLYFYNTTNEIDKLIQGIEKVKEIFKI
jgi:cysteine desulfurase / selenocysteine lyase